MPTLQDLVKIEKFGDRHYRASSIREPVTRTGDGANPASAVGNLCLGYPSVLGELLGAGEVKVVDRTVEPADTDGGGDD